MSKNKRKKKRPGGGAPVASNTALAAELVGHVDLIESTEPAGAGPLWGQTHKLLLKLRVDPQTIVALVARRDVPELRRIATALAAGEDPAAVNPDDTDVEPDDAPVAATGEPPSHEELKKAMRAFKKRLKLTRLDHESKLGVGPMTGGKESDIAAILAPRDFPDEVWEALVQEGRLRRRGKSFFELVE